MSDSAYLSYERAIVRIIDKQGNVLHQNYFRPGNDNNAFHSVEVTKDNGLILGGYTEQGNQTKCLMVRTDSTCQIKPVGINSSSTLIQDFNLHQNYPNPFNPTTTISFDLPQKEFVTLKVFDINGKQIMTLLNEQQEAGIHSVTVNGIELSTGVYFYELQAGKFKGTGKMVLIR